MADSGTTRVALVGCGFIAEVHMQVLKAVPGVRVVAVCDPAPGRAERMARRYGVGQSFLSVEELIAAGVCDAVHVLVPPGAHRAVAQPCLEAGLHVLVEKPIALSIEDADALDSAATKRGVALGVNHNQTSHPAMAQLEQQLAKGRLGRLEHLSLVHNVPLRQLQSGDVGHFMFRTEANILLEQGVHLFSMVHRLLGECRSVEAVTGDPVTLPNGARFFDEWQLSMRCERGTASVRMAFGKSMLETTVQAIGTDGAALIDLQRSSCWVRGKSRWLEFLDQGLWLFRGGRHLLARTCGAVFGYGLSLFKLRFPDDPFLRGMRGSLQEFHAAVRAGKSPANDADAGRAVLTMCRMAAEAAGASTEERSRPPLPEPGPARQGEVVVLGGAGMIGKRCVALLRRAERPVTLIVRRPQLLPDELLDGSVRIFQGDASDREVLDRAFDGADCVLHLATVAGDDPSRIEETMAGAVRTAAEVCLDKGIRRMVYASSTAALYLGGSQALTGATGPDPKPVGRGVYGRGKIRAEHELVALRDKGLDAVIVRPAIVLSPGGAMEHSGVGLWVRDNHCVGWGRGNDPLPLILAEDCAQGLVAALHSDAAKNRSYNLSGPVRLTAREFLDALRSHTGRDYHFHSTPIWWMWTQEMGKHLVKVLARRPRVAPSLRDFRSRSFRAPLDCSDAERDLGFAPERDRQMFLQRLFGGAEPAPQPEEPVRT